MTKYIIEGKMLQNSIFHLEGKKKYTLYTNISGNTYNKI